MAQRVADRSRTLAALALVVVSALTAAACTGARLEQPGQVAAGDTVVAGDGATKASTAGPGKKKPDRATGSKAAGGAGGSGSGGATTPITGDGGGSIDRDGDGKVDVVSPGSFRSTLFRGANDTMGITDTEIKICVHAALTYGAAFNTGEEDLNVYWEAVNAAGGIYGRKVKTVYVNDNYQGSTAVTEAGKCVEEQRPFMLVGGIGFDQIPLVRNWAEDNKVFYFHHTATVNNPNDNKPGAWDYSFTALPTAEKMGAMFAELAIWKFPGKKIGIIERQSPNWKPGVKAFERLAKERNLDIVYQKEAPQNQGSYLQNIIDMKNAGAEVVWIWLNALESTEFIKQAKAQNFSPHFMVFPFNLTTQTLGDDALNPKLIGVSMHNAYSFGDYSGQFANYAADIKLFEQQYATYQPSADIRGIGGDLIFLNWSGQKSFHKLLLQCGRSCTRNRMVELLHSYKGSVTPSACTLDYTRAGLGNDHRGGWAVSVMEPYRAAGDKVNWRNIKTCVEHLI